ncbi:beta-N-acetylhexosaminidase [Sphingobacterium lumbrici]|uniref:beta-N-acetylhexosaminidase n=1 Tax=Sphingobacterium lumbrici TaxID=2559600 RepID=UPI00112EAF6B|nr:beta-N-acetylhexosaminidase [Sphingobacterium lumbrici]
MKLRSIFNFVLILFIAGQSLFAQHIGIIPQPQEVTVFKDSLVVGKVLNLSANEEVGIATIQYLRHALADKYQIYSTINKDKEVQISFGQLKLTKEVHEEEYELTISNNRITIVAGHPHGYFNGVNSLLQLMAFYETPTGIKIPNLKIVDSPAYGWRGFMLDESRHFFGKKKVKQLLDWMAFYKLNKFHWHLTDEPAWRIEIKQYPFLALVGGIGSYTNPLSPTQYYTQEEIREIVAYATERFIDVIPEIDMPGHATAANRAYPQFSGGGTKDHPDFTFHPAKEGTYQYLTNILKETNVLFPSNMLHLGGDEVSFGSEAWNADASIQKMKLRYNYRTNKEVETHFMRRMADSVYHIGAKLVVWDEMADAGLPKDKTIQYWWRHDKIAQLELALENGYATVVCPRIPFYFDFVQDEKDRHGRKWGRVFNPLESVYNYDLDPLKAKEQYPNQILGVQANLWTEGISTIDKLDYMIFPRIAALAETAWTKNDRKNFTEFQQVLKKHLQLYKTDRIYYYDPFNKTLSEPQVEILTKKYLDNPE